MHLKITRTWLQALDNYGGDGKGESKALYKESHNAKQSKNVHPGSPLLFLFGMQVKYIVQRNFLRMKGDPSIPLFSVVGPGIMGF